MEGQLLTRNGSVLSASLNLFHISKEIMLCLAYFASSIDEILIFILIPITFLLLINLNHLRCTICLSLTGDQVDVDGIASSIQAYSFFFLKKNIKSKYFQMQIKGQNKFHQKNIINSINMHIKLSDLNGFGWIWMRLFEISFIMVMIRQQQEESVSSEATSRREDDNIHPNQLSGDQNQDKNIHPSTAEQPKANFFFSTTIVAKTAIGAGIISMPYTFSELGYILAPVIFLIFLALTNFSTSILLKSKNLSKHSNYSTIMYYLWPTDKSRLLGSILIFANNLALCILQFVLIKNSVYSIHQQIDPEAHFNSSIPTPLFQGSIIVTIAALIGLPFTLIKKIQNFRMYSFIGVTGILVFVFALISQFFIRMVDGKLRVNSHPFPTQFFGAGSAFVNIGVAFYFQSNFFPIWKGLKDPTDSRMKKVCSLGLVECGIPYLLVGYFGYFLTSDSNQNFLRSLIRRDTNDFLFFLINSCYILSLFFAIILDFFGCRNNFINIVNILRTKLKKNGLLSIKSQSSQFFFLTRQDRVKKSNKQYIVLTVILYIIIIVSAIFIPQQKFVFNFLGAICYTLLTVIMPCLFYVILVRRGNYPRYMTYYVAIGVMVVLTICSLTSVVCSFLLNSQET